MEGRGTAHPPQKPGVGNQQGKLEKTGLGKLLRSKFSESLDS